MTHKKKPAATKTRSLSETLLAIDSRYFGYCDYDDNSSEEDAAHNLATWLFDQGCIKRLKRQCSPSLYQLTLKHLIEGRHDR